MAEHKWYWWEVQFTDRTGQPADIIDTCGLYTAGVERLELEDVDQDENGQPRESTHFVESDVFIVVKTLDDDPYAAMARAIAMLHPSILEDRRDVIWHQYPHEIG